VPQNNEYCIRTYIQGDENDLILLFNKAYDHFAGLVPRTLEYWKWCILSRPNLSEEGIAVVVNADKIVGYAAVDKSGNILELCYDPDHGRKKIVSMLLTWCIDYVRFQGGNSVSLNAPVQDGIIRQACKESEFTEEPFPTLFLKVQDLPQLLKKIVGQENRLKRDFQETVVFSLRKVPSSCPNHVVLQIQNGTAIVLMDDEAKPTIKIEVDLSTISECVFGSRRRLYKAILDGRLKVRPLRKVIKAMKILSLLQLRNPWYIPGADFG